MIAHEEDAMNAARERKRNCNNGILIVIFIKES